MGAGLAHRPPRFVGFVGNAGLPVAERTIATMPARITSGRSAHRSAMRARSGSVWLSWGKEGASDPLFSASCFKAKDLWQSGDSLRTEVCRFESGRLYFPPATASSRL